MPLSKEVQMMWRHKMCYWLGALFIFQIPITFADCKLGNGAVSLGTNGSFYIYNNPLKAKGYTGFSCSGLVINISLLNLSYLKANILSSSNNMMLKNSDGSAGGIPYLIYPDEQYKFGFSVGDVVDYSRLGLLNIALGKENIDIAVYIKTSAGANVKAGVYSDVINVQWDYFICRSGLLVCLTWWRGKGEVTPITVTSVVEKDCIINDAPDVNFGSRAMVAQFDAITQSIKVSCTNDEGYKVWLSDGNNKQGNWRRMTNGKGAYLEYQLYQANNTTVWDSNQKVSLVGTGNTQSITYTAKINPSQAEVFAGNYMDEVLVVVEY